MNIQVEKTNPQVQELRIEISKEDYVEKVETALKKQRRTAQIPGFRPGNAPMGMIRKMYEKSLISDELNHIIGEALYGHIKENNHKILGEPLPIDEKTIVNIDQPDTPFVFTFEFALEPEFDIQYDALPKVQYYQFVAQENEIDNYIQQIRKRHGEYITPETISEEDYVTVTYNETDGFCFVSDFNETGKNLFVGKKTDDQISCNLADIFSEKEKLAQFLKVKEEEINDTPIETTISIKHIGRITEAELNDEFFKKAFPDGSVTNEKELRAIAAKTIESEWENHSKKQFMNDSIGILLEHIQIEFPDDFLKRFILASQKEMTPENLDEKYEDYKRSFKWQLIENKIVTENNIQVSSSDVEEYIRNFFVKNYFSNFDPKEIEDKLNTLVADALKNKEDIKNIYDQLYDQKIEETLRSKMNIEYKSGSFTDYLAEINNPGTEAQKTSSAKKAKKSPEKLTEQAKGEVKAPKKTTKKA